MTGRFPLFRETFTRSESLLIEIGGLRAYAFAYESGVEAVRIASRTGQIVVLPYQGQQIWEAEFGGRSLKMKNFFTEPVASRDLLDSYGAFLYHCGALRMGTPGPEDDHPLHGELPAAPYASAWVVFGGDAGGPFLGVSGSYVYARAFGDKYRATPEVRMHEGRGTLDVSMTIENLAHYPMDLMYMCHVNFLPADNGEIVQAAGWGADDMIVRSQIPSHVKPTEKYLKFLESLKKNPEVTRVLRPEDEYNPEVVFYLKNLRYDSEGRTHLLQKHPDGTSDYVSYDVRQLDHTVRWILKHQDQQVNGMALPSTCDPEGYTSEKKKGNVRSLGASQQITFGVRVGYLDRDDTVAMEKLIKGL